MHKICIAEIKIDIFANLSMAALRNKKIRPLDLKKKKLSLEKKGCDLYNYSKLTHKILVALRY